MGRVLSGILVVFCIAAAVAAFGARVRAPAALSGVGASSSSGRELRGAVGRSVAVATLDAEAGRVRHAVSRAGGTVPLEHAPVERPGRTDLMPNHPNPFNPATTISYTVDRPTHVRLAVYDPSGRLVAVLVDERREPGEVHAATWRGVDGDGRAVSSGVYFVRMETERAAETKKMILLK